MTEAPRVTVFRKEHFNAAHRLHNPQWTAEKNKEISTIYEVSTSTDLKTGAENYNSYLPILAGKKVGIVTNQTGILKIESENIVVENGIKSDHVTSRNGIFPTYSLKSVMY